MNSKSKRGVNIQEGTLLNHKVSDILSFAAKWIEMEDMMLSKRDG